MLTFHGMTVFIQEGRFRQLLVKTCIALLLGWHVYALLLPFIVFGLVGEIIKLRPAVSPSPARVWLVRQLYRARAYLSLFRSRYLTLGVVALLFGLAVLSFNFANEYIALDGEKGLTELPSVHSMLYRAGQKEWFNTAYADQLAWQPFLKEQFYRIAGMSVPYSLPVVGDELHRAASARFGLYVAIVGMIVFCACLAGLMFVRPKILWATLVLSGFCWALPLRHSVAFHVFEAMFYIGIPLVFFSLILLYIRRLSSDRLVAVLSVAALLVFAIASFQMSRIGHNTAIAWWKDSSKTSYAEAAEYQRTMVADFEVIRRITIGKTVFVPQEPLDAGFSGARQSTAYYLSGSVILFEHQADQRHLADFILLRERFDGPALLTPENRLAFLYDQELYQEPTNRIIEKSGKPPTTSPTNKPP